MKPSAQATVARDPRRDVRFVLAGLMLASVLVLAPNPADAKEPLRPREAREVENGQAKASSATRARTSSSADRSDRSRARSGDRHRARRSDRHHARRGDRHHARRGGYGRYDRSHHRDRYRRSIPRYRSPVRYRPYYRDYGYYSPYRFSSSYWLRYRPYYHYYGALSVYPLGWPSVYIGGGYGHAAYGRSAYGRMGGFDLDVKPEKAEIYVDGKYMGVADDYDGFPEYLWLESGTYDITFYAEGYETITRQYDVRPGRVIDVSDKMRAGEATRPEERISESTARRDERLERDRERRDAALRTYPLPRASDRSDDRSEMLLPSTDGSRLFLEVMPEDAVVYLDGEFVGRAGDLSTLRRGLVVEPGQHTLEIVRPGYETQTRDIVVPVGEPFELVIELEASAL